MARRRSMAVATTATVATERRPLGWFTLFLEGFLLAMVGCGASVVFFSAVPLFSLLMVMFIVAITFPLTRRFDLQTHVIMVFALWIALILLALEFPQTVAASSLFRGALLGS